MQALKANQDKGIDDMNTFFKILATAFFVLFAVAAASYFTADENPAPRSVHIVLAEWIGMAAVPVLAGCLGAWYKPNRWRGFTVVSLLVLALMLFGKFS